MAHHVPFLAVAFGALSTLGACTITIQTAPQQPPAGYYAPVPVAAGAPVPIAGTPYPVYEQPARRPGHAVAAAAVIRRPGVSRTAAAAPSPPLSAVRPSVIVRSPSAGVAPRPVAFPAQGAAPVAAQPPVVAPAPSPAPVATPPSQPTGPLAPPVRRPDAVGTQKAEPRDKSNETTVK